MTRVSYRAECTRLVVVGLVTVGLAAPSGATQASFPPAVATAALVDPVGQVESSTTTSPLAGNEKAGVQEAARKVIRYWNSERMRGAISVPTGRRAIAQRIGEPTGAPATQPPAERTEGAAVSSPRLASLAAATAKPSRTVGKAFFTDPKDGKNYSCSAAALNSESKQLVITAGHCVHHGKGGTWMKNWVFVPAYRNGTRPFGTFVKKQFRAFDAWMDDSDTLKDVGMVTTQPIDGKRLVNVVGGNGLMTGKGTSFSATVLGYPGNKAGGEVQQVCQGEARADGGFSTDPRPRIDCGFGRGISGGPFLRNYDSDSQLGDVNGVASVGVSGTVTTPYFGDGVWDMFKKQGGVT